MAAAGLYLPSARGRILDLGVGTGRFSDALARFRGASVVAWEPSAAKRAALCSTFPRALVVGGAAETIPFRAGAFDAVWASQVVHHVRDLPAFAAGLRHVLRPTGHLLIRGGFGPVQDLPLYRYFPLAWAEGNAVRLTFGADHRRADRRGFRDGRPRPGRADLREERRRVGGESESPVMESSGRLARPGIRGRVLGAAKGRWSGAHRWTDCRPAGSRGLASAPWAFSRRVGPVCAAGQGRLGHTSPCG
jgi:SAM-dependent methyltransferase